MNAELHSHDNFDTHLQRLHAQALASLSADTLARLRQARRAAAPPCKRRTHWFLTSACSALLVTGIGLHFFPTTSQAPTLSVPTATPATQQLDIEGDLLDQNPDLYLWLATENSLAME